MFGQQNKAKTTQDNDLADQALRDAATGQPPATPAFTDNGSSALTGQLGSLSPQQVDAIISSQASVMPNVIDHTTANTNIPAASIVTPNPSMNATAPLPTATSDAVAPQVQNIAFVNQPTIPTPPPSVQLSSGSLHIPQSTPTLIQETTPTTAPPLATSVDTGSLQTADEGLLKIKQDALTALMPLVDQIEQTPLEKFRTLMMMIQAADDKSLIESAYQAAQQIDNEKERAQALLDVVNEINYFYSLQNKTTSA